MLLFLCGLGSVLFLAGASPGRPWDAMGFALSPTLLLAGLVNWDLLAVLFLAGALWAWARGRPLLAGVMVGLGTATKLYPLFLLGAFLVDVLRRRRLDLGALALAGAAGAWLLVDLPALLTGVERGRCSGPSTPSAAPTSARCGWSPTSSGCTASADPINLVSGVLFAVACAGDPGARAARAAAAPGRPGRVPGGGRLPAS